jgi:NTE family protein
MSTQCSDRASSEISSHNEPMSAPANPRVALVLGAGGAVGHAFNVGVLSAIADEFGWDARDADLIVGTSAGSVVGASLRVGLDPLDLRRRALGQPLSADGAALIRRAETAVSEARVAAAEVAEDEPTVVDGLAARAARLRVSSPERLMRAFREPWKVTPGSLFSAIVPAGRLPTGYIGAAYEDLHGDGWPHRDLWIATVDLDVGARVVFGRETSPEATLGQAVEASCAIPGYFAPVTIGDARYVDGGAHSTTNADLVAEFEPKPDLALVTVPMSAVGSALRTPRNSIRQLARRSVAREARLLRDQGIEVVTFQPTAADLEVMSGDSMDPTKSGAVCRQVVESTLTHVRDPEIADRLTALRD